MPDINASLVDQQLTCFLEKHGDRLAGDECRRRSTAFLLTCMKRVLDISDDEAFDLLTHAPQEVVVDGMHVGDVVDNEFAVTLFLAHYRQDLETGFNFPTAAVASACTVVRDLFDLHRTAEMNPALAVKAAEVKSLLADGFIPRIRVVLCSNGRGWNEEAQREIDAIRSEFASQVEFHHFNHAGIIRILSRAHPVDASLKLQGQILVEDHDFRRVLVGRMHVRELAALYRQHGNGLFPRNMRRPLEDDRVHESLEDMLASDAAGNLYFCSDGLTMVCDGFGYNAFQRADHVVRLKNLQIVNGYRTFRTIGESLQNVALHEMPEASVMVRIFEVVDDREDFVRSIARAADGRSPVDQQDLHSDDAIQKELEVGLSDLGFTYKRGRDEMSVDVNALPGSLVAEAVLAVWRERPHQAKFMRREHFGQLYELIFSNLNAAQVLLAVTIFRDVEARRRNALAEAPAFTPYASHYAAMIIGRRLLAEAGLSCADEIDHRTIDSLLSLYEEKKYSFYQEAAQAIQSALNACYGNREISLQQLSATFRRGDLLAILS